MHGRAGRQISGGLSYQNWQFNIETIARGWRHVVARDIIVVKRRRGASLVTETAVNKAVVRLLEPTAIDRVAVLGKAQHPATRSPASPASGER